MNEDIWVDLIKTDPQEAEILRGKLESNGIEVELKQEGFGKLAGITVDGLGEVTIMVPGKQKEEAEEVLEN